MQTDPLVSVSVKMASTSRKTSPIWSFFSIAEDSKYAVCKSCQQKISHGGATTKTFNTLILVSHLKNKHVEEHKEFEKQKQKVVESKDKQPSMFFKGKQSTLEESKDRARVWDVNDARAQQFTEMIALDCQPFSIVDNIGFMQLLKALEPRYLLPSRRYVTETILLKLKDEITAKLKVELAGVEYFSFTIDIWSTDVSNDSLLSLTAHWLTDLFVMRSAVLHAQSFSGSHTGENIWRTYGWSIKKEEFHLIVRDNAANMVKAMRDASFPDLGYFAHDGVLSQRFAVAVCSNTHLLHVHVWKFKKI